MLHDFPTKGMSHMKTHTCLSHLSPSSKSFYQNQRSQESIPPPLNIPKASPHPTPPSTPPPPPPPTTNTPI
ncbi:hypothetical protein L6452_12244 [Arctium lappa]|uniref:Uncharacterized protein n=1 Tax=Arctium lappa TaxID=4217 RepID=A0ACB9DQ68_ARCLA|nr:hypothetical protein L6452_12244 [Arctium lappa]